MQISACCLQGADNSSQGTFPGPKPYGKYRPIAYIGEAPDLLCERLSRSTPLSYTIGNGTQSDIKKHPKL